ncbi:tryptophan-rich sensory protein [Leptolyngbya sp. FACHB-261]|uniref:tryptophan-rich sensory protein n=1 Tax=Leptolyngbya sp. FACHB-261 TaxID=2692806 RepID=UPI0016867250|nr:tryptophan-rich sensory protein [Leptolyngbya sp. FACHB-261]MBD2099760.1 tryptophan-rich sensory protein [Leptolyngbya sp. FACHB-261]
MRTSAQEPQPGLALPIATLVAILATLTVNVLSNFFPPQGLNIGQISNTILRGVQITPANYAFAIWGLIYLGLICYGIYQLLPAQRSNLTLRQVDTLLIIACIAQIIWVYLFTLQQFWLSVVAILAILLPLIGAYLRLGAGRRPSRTQRWLVYVPLSIYLGWISVATIVNVASALYNSGWNGWGISAEGWTVIMLIVGAAIGGLIALRRADVAFTLVFVWAYVAIAVRQVDNPAIRLTAGMAAIAMIALLVFSRSRRSSRPGSLDA